MTSLAWLAGEATAGKMADGKAGEDKPEKPQRAGAVGGEHNPKVALGGGRGGVPGWEEARRGASVASFLFPFTPRLVLGPCNPVQPAGILQGRGGGSLRPRQDPDRAQSMTLAAPILCIC